MTTTTPNPDSCVSFSSSSFHDDAYSVQGNETFEALTITRNNIASMMSSRLSRGIVHLFHPLQHLWLRVFPLYPSSACRSPSPSASKWIGVEIGLTARGLEEVGDIVSLRKMRTPDTKIKEGDAILVVEWEGHSITNADELYHTIWETLEGAKTIRSPVNGVIETISDDITFDENSVLIRMVTSLDDLERATENDILIRESNYARLLTKISPGMFKES